MNQKGIAQCQWIKLEPIRTVSEYVLNKCSPCVQIDFRMQITTLIINRG
jgi:hypothetical protein